MTKGEVIKRVAEETGSTKSVAEGCYDSLVGCLQEVLKGEGMFRLPELGKWEVKPTKERKGRNPQTGEEIIVPAGQRISFKASTALKASVLG